MHVTARMALFSEAYITAISAAVGVDIVSTRTDDDSIDVTLKSRRQGRPRLEVQLKATSQTKLERRVADFPFVLSRKNYDELRLTMDEQVVPRILVVLIMPSEGEEWLLHAGDAMTLRHCCFYLNLRGMEEIATGTKTVRIPWANEFTVGALDGLMDHIAIHKELPA